MNRFRNLTITTKLTLLFILFAALILIGIGSLAYFSGRAALEQAVTSDLESTANEKQAALNRWLDDRLNLVVSITGFPTYRARVNSLIHDNLDDAARKTLQAQIAQALAGFSGPNGNYTEMMIVEAQQGQVVVSTQPENQGKFNEDRPYFIEGLKGPFVQNVIYSLSERAPILVVAAPIKADDGSVIAVLAARLKLDEMNEIVLRRTGQRETDDALLVDPSNLFVTQPRFIIDPAVLQRGVHTEPVNRCLAGNSGILAANDYRGVPVMAAYRWMPERQLCLIVKMDQAEAFAPSNTFGQTLALIAVVTLALASLLGFGLARTITHPLQQLVEAAQEIGAGKLETRIDVKTGDEIGQLAGAFVQMAQDLQKTLVSRDDLFKEVAERKQAEEEVQKLNAELEQRVVQRTTQLEFANKELEAFSYSVSHDLRSPLRGIDGWSQALLEDYGSLFDEQGKTYINRVRSETQRMGNLIDDLLKLSRLTRAEMHIEGVNLSAIAQSIAVQLQETAPERQVDFVIQPGLTSNGDARLLEIALTNLLGNAFKFTGNTPQARIEFEQAEIEGHHTFFVRDNGAGFDMALAKNLFGAFQRMHRTSEFPGTGIGLTIVQRIIYRHGGRIWAEAAVDQGAAFYFTLEERI